MVATAQLGVLAACIVLFVPMGMAGWHLSRNKMLFFSGALFITLAVGVHLAPYFPAASQFILSSLSPSKPLTHPFRSSSCISSVHDVSFFPLDAPSDFDWAPARSLPPDCGFQKISRDDAGVLLNGSWILVAGDSQARLFVLALLRLFLNGYAMEAVEEDLFRRHSDYQNMIPEYSIKLDFLWSPFESNLTSVLGQILHGPRLPEIVVAGSGLWHMLHVNNASEYGGALSSVRSSGAALASLSSSGLAVQSPHMFWLGMPALVNSMLNTEEKKEKMSRMVWEAYDQEVDGSGLLTHSGGPFMLLDIGLLTKRCGPQCTSDGMHYDKVVYEAALHIMLNALLVESQQWI